MAKTISKPNTTDNSISTQIQMTLKTNATLTPDNIITTEYIDDIADDTAINGSMQYIADQKYDIQTTFGDLELTVTQVKEIATSTLRSQKISESSVTEDVTNSTTKDIIETNGYAKILNIITRRS